MINGFLWKTEQIVQQHLKNTVNFLVT